MNAYRVMAGVLIGSLVILAPLYLTAYLPVLNLPLVAACAIVYIALSCVSAVVLRSVLSSNNKVDDLIMKSPKARTRTL